MKKSLKIILIVIIILISIILLDTLQARIFKNSPIISWKEELADADSWVDKGILIDTYYCTEEKDIVTVSWKFKGSKFTCPIDNGENDTTDYSEVYACLENELGAYIMTEKDNASEIPLTDITDKKEQVEYYKGIKANEKNMYIIFKGNVTYEWEVMKDFQLYFSKKFPVYQRYFMMDKSIYIFIHNNANDVKFDEIINKCNNGINKEDGKTIKSKTLNSLNKTNKIVIKSGDTEIGTINNKDSIDNILNVISNSKQSGDAFLCDGNSFDFEMYNNNKLIDTVYVWHDGSRLIPKSIHSGCSYYWNTNDKIDLREIIEKETDYIFYDISDYSDNCDSALELIYEDDKYNYYLSCEKSDKFFIHFTLSNLQMTLKYALNNNYITPDKLEGFTDLFIKKEK